MRTYEKPFTTDRNIMDILIYGAGAVGQAVGGMLAADGHRVDLVLRERFLDAVRRGGIGVTGIFGEHHAPHDQIRAFADISGLDDCCYDYAIVTTKSYDTAVAADVLDGIGNRIGRVVSMQNGCGNMELLAGRFGAARTLAARVITGFEIVRPGLVRITVSADAIHIGGMTDGEIHPASRSLANALAHAGLPCAATDHIRRDLFAKLLYNSALNPLGAILGVPYGALGDDPDSREVIDAVIDEVFLVITAMGAATHWKDAAGYRDYFYNVQLPATYHHRSSMLQDLEQGKRTEIEALTGYIVREGVRVGTATPVCETLTRQVRFLERGRSGSACP